MWRRESVGLCRDRCVCVWRRECVLCLCAGLFVLHVYTVVHCSVLCGGYPIEILGLRALYS